MTVRALIVEDEENLVRLLRGYLEREGFEVREALDGIAALEAVRESEPDVIVLDWMLPKLDGMGVLRELRRFSDAYVIVLTARVEEVDRIVGLSTGADDYLTKPFSPGELVARIRAMLRRPRGETSTVAGEETPVSSGELSVDRGRREVRLGGREVSLTAIEFDLLAALISRPGLVFSREPAPGAGLGRGLLRRRPRGGRPRRQPAQEDRSRTVEPQVRPDRTRGGLQVPPSVKQGQAERPRRSSRGLGARLFLSHFLVALVGAITTLTVTFILVPVVLGRLSGGASGFGRILGPSLLYSLLLAGLAATVAAAVAGLLVSRRVVGSLRYVVDATRRIASGRYGERVPVRDDDELGELSASFNTMARALDEAERRRMEVIYDLSHELRTPLSTLRGYTEGLAEGVIQPSEEIWALLQTEADRMGRLVDDLRRLSQAEAGQLDLDLAPILPRGSRPARG